MIIHCDEESVKEAMKLERMGRNRALDRFRKQAIKLYNLDELKKDNLVYMRERASRQKNVINNLKSECEMKKSVEAPIMCTKCYSFFANGYISRHIKASICGRESGILMVPVMSLKACNIVSDYNDEFKNLSKLNSDKVSDYIKKDPIIMMIGSRFFDTVRKRKIKEVETASSVHSP